MNSLWKFFTDTRTYRHVVDSMDSFYIHHKKISLYAFLKLFIKHFDRHELLDRSGGVAFSFTLAVFPALIFLFALIPYIPVANLDKHIVDFIGEIAMLDQVEHTILDIVTRPRKNFISFGVIFAFILATNGMMGLISAFNNIYSTVERRSYLKTRLVATVLTIMLSFAMFLTIMMLFIGQLVIEFMLEAGFLDENFMLTMIFLVRFAVLVVMFLMVISNIYYFGPALHRRWKFFSPGAIFATIGTTTVSYAFSFYLTNFGTYNKLYGSIGAMIALMVWLYFVAVILLIGFEINTTLDEAIKRVEKDND